MTVFEIMKRCTIHIRDEWQEEWPEDSWLSLGTYWEANIFLDNGSPAISVYPVWQGVVLSHKDPIRIL